MMISTLTTLFRAQAADAEDALIDANGPTLLAQHLRDARADVDRSRRLCAGLMARRTTEARRIERLGTDMTRREEQAGAALAAGQDDLANDIADRIVHLEDQRDSAGKARDDLDRRISALRESLAQADRRIETLAADLRLARSGAAGRASMVRLAEGTGPCALNRAEEMAARVRALDTGQEDLCTAMRDLRADPAGLDARIRAADLTDAEKTRRNGVLARLNAARPPSHPTTET